jgi:hypothetical protein
MTVDVSHGSGGGVKMAWVPIRRQMTCGWPGTRSSSHDLGIDIAFAMVDAAIAALGEKADRQDPQRSVRAT